MLLAKPELYDRLVYDGTRKLTLIGWLDEEESIAIVKDEETLKTTYVIVQFEDGSYNKSLSKLEEGD